MYILLERYVPFVVVGYLRNTFVYSIVFPVYVRMFWC